MYYLEERHISMLGTSICVIMTLASGAGGVIANNILKKRKAIEFQSS